MLVTRYEELYQPTSSRELNTVVMRGTAVAILVLSSAITKVESVRPNVSKYRGESFVSLGSSSLPGSASAEDAVAADVVRV